MDAVTKEPIWKHRALDADGITAPGEVNQRELYPGDGNPAHSGPGETQTKGLWDPGGEGEMEETAGPGMFN